MLKLLKTGGGGGLRSLFIYYLYFTWQHDQLVGVCSGRLKKGGVKCGHSSKKGDPRCGSNSKKGGS